MKKEHIVFLLIIFAVGIAGGIARAARQAPADPVAAIASSLIVANPSLRPGGQTSVRVTAFDDTHGAVRYEWKAEAGTASAVDTNPVIWTAPATEGRYEVSVEATDAAGNKTRGSAAILVSNYPANPLVMSVDPAKKDIAKR